LLIAAIVHHPFENRYRFKRTGIWEVRKLKNRNSLTLDTHLSASHSLKALKPLEISRFGLT